MALWDVEVEEVRSLTVTVEARNLRDAKRVASQRDQWLDCSRADTVHLEPGDASPQTTGEVDCLDVVKFHMENREN